MPVTEAVKDVIMEPQRTKVVEEGLAPGDRQAAETEEALPAAEAPVNAVTPVAAEEYLDIVGMMAVAEEVMTEEAVALSPLVCRMTNTRIGGRAARTPNYTESKNLMR